MLIKNPRGLSDAHLASIEENLKGMASSRIGESMLYELIEYCKDSLTDNNHPSSVCSICLEIFQDTDIFFRTNCYHYFHVICIKAYINMLNEKDLICPVCRKAFEIDESLLRSVSDAKDGQSEEIKFSPTDEYLEWRKYCTKLFEKQKRKGGIIDLEFEKSKYLISSAKCSQPITTTLTTKKPTSETPVETVSATLNKKQDENKSENRHIDKQKKQRKGGHGNSWRSGSESSGRTGEEKSWRFGREKVNRDGCSARKKDVMDVSRRVPFKENNFPSKNERREFDNKNDFLKSKVKSAAETRSCKKTSFESETSDRKNSTGQCRTYEGDKINEKTNTARQRKYIEGSLQNSNLLSSVTNLHNRTHGSASFKEGVKPPPGLKPPRPGLKPPRPGLKPPPPGLKPLPPGLKPPPPGLKPPPPGLKSPPPGFKPPTPGLKPPPPGLKPPSGFNVPSSLSNS
ncbi:protein enabled homolog isoform X2 [Hydractinia symbiolongicarpus]|nr:protein enabled homolog isoform X2 [Hydractinia symbiolongicarpus]XP_057295564.1 protein enabled homolog isoform X2 [Hydractinia symbiolongicarpus]XP_057295565.1 protein enabled homolog isoform X2 [Hydractinia symbiolongicarpus]